MADGSADQVYSFLVSGLTTPLNPTPAEPHAEYSISNVGMCLQLTWGQRL